MVKDNDKLTKLYTLHIPNGEIRVGLMQSFLPNASSSAGCPCQGRYYFDLEQHTLGDWLIEE